MGGLFSTFGFSSLPDLNIDLGNVSPKDPQEEDILRTFRSAIAEPYVEILNKFRGYKDGQSYASLALSTPTQENKDTAWEAIMPNVLLQMEIYSFSKKISEYFVELVRVVMDIAADKAIDIFANKPVITKCFADCFDIILRFDETCLTIPKLVNDLAFFRRNAPLRNNDGSLDDLIENSNLSTVFWAVPMPFLSNTIGQLSQSFKLSPESFEKLLVLLGSVVDVCTALGLKNIENVEKPMLLLLRCIVGATIMLDHLSPQGAYSGARFHVKEAMELLVNYEPKQMGLINSIKYTSKHLSDPTSDPRIKTLFDIKQ